MLPSCKPEPVDQQPSSLPSSLFYRQDTGFFQDFKVFKVQFQALNVGGDSSLAVNGDTSIFYYRYQYLNILQFENRKAIAIERWKRNDTLTPWVFDSTLIQWKNELGLFRQVNNAVLHLLPARIDAQVTWNRNAFNSLPGRNCRVLNFDINRLSAAGPTQTGLEVLIFRIPQNLVNVAEFTEEYRQGIGLYRVFRKEISYAQGNGLLGLFVPESGEIYEEIYLGEGEL